MGRSRRAIAVRVGAVAVFVAALFVAFRLVQAPCDAGQARTFASRGRCCFDGQRYEEGRCRGAPRTCPAGFEAQEERCVLPAPEGMVAVPGGPFEMGCYRKIDPICGGNERELRTVVLDSFFIDRLEATVSDYARCVDAGACTDDHVSRTVLPEDRRWDRYCTWPQRSSAPDLPMTCIDWDQAQAFCAWQGKRLPTEAEWEKAARGKDARIYPWGNAWPTGEKIANIEDDPDRGIVDGYVANAPVGTFPAGRSPYGALDMAGNVMEWTADPYEDREGYRVKRGGGWDSQQISARTAARDTDPATFYFNNIGVRCARSLAPATPSAK